MPTLVWDRFRHDSQTRQKISELSLKELTSLIKLVDLKINLYSLLLVHQYATLGLAIFNTTDEPVTNLTRN
jgi:hypothetical protein